jgi:hypothetical protein
MPKDVTVSLKDLRFLVKLAWALSVESHAQKALRVHQISKNPRVVKEYVAAVRAALPEAKKQETKRYDELLKSLKSGENVRQSLANFATREAKSPDASGTKVRRIP